MRAAPVFFLAPLLACALLLACGRPDASEFHSAWEDVADQPWAGADYWANPLQDWRIRDGRLENFQAGGDRNVFLLTREVNARQGDLELSVHLGRPEEFDAEPLDEGFVGFRVGIGGYFDDYRDSAVRGNGLNAGMAADGRLFIGGLEEGAAAVEPPFENIELRFSVSPSRETYLGVLTAFDPEGAELASVSRNDLEPEWLTGGIALVSSSGPVAETPDADLPLHPGFGAKAGTERGGAMRFWFRDWMARGSKLDAFPDRRFGPILFAMHTLDRGVLTLTAQMAPADGGPAAASLEINRNGSWTEAAAATVDADARTARFRVADWDDARDTPYRVLYQGDVYEGTVRKNPIDKGEIVVAAFTGNNDLGFPHADIVRNVKTHSPDFLAYTGDNIYERVGEYGTQRDIVELAILDYLRKWYLFGWEYRDLLKDIPAVAIPDDHDVYQGNIWGAGGKAAEGTGQPGQDSGGFTMPARFVQVVVRTQTSNLPEPYDPEPIEQGIAVYFTDILYGGVSFAVLEDRQWKSPPKVLLPRAQIVNGWSKNPRYDAARDGDVPGAELLGERQEKFLDAWSTDWSDGAWIKSVISQTIFNNVATLPAGTDTDAVTSTLRVMAPGEYAQGEAPVQDHDSNGWPQTPRNRALRLMRQGFAFHIAGDQHLGSTIHYGIDAWNDAGWAICVPSVANIFPRRWFPPQPGANRQDGMPANTGQYLDGFGNKMTVWAVSNPIANGVEPTAINHRAPGYGIVKFRRADRKIEIANWPRWVDASAPGAKPYPGWPITIDQLDNGFPADGPALPEVSSEADDPVVEVLDSQSGETIYAVRIRGKTFTPRVRERGRYTVRVDGQTAYENQPAG